MNYAGIKSPHLRAGMSKQLQNQLWRMVWVRMERALESGAWLEAIALQDSMINERLESLGSYASGESSFQSLDRNIKACMKLELLDDEIAVLDAVNIWRETRNRSMHRMVKYSESDFTMNLEQRLQYIQECASSGKTLVRSTKNAVDRAKRRF